MDYAVSRENVEAIIDRELMNIPGWCSPEKSKRMAELARGAGLCVELGVFGGRGMISMGLCLQDQGRGRVDGIDPFNPAAALEGANDPANDAWWAQLDYEGIERAAQEVIYRLKLMPYARLVRMLSREAVVFYEDESVDLLHQDSNHAEEISCEEVALWTPKIKPGGHWIFDDADWPTTQQAQRELEKLGFSEMENHVRWKVYQKCS